MCGRTVFSLDRNLEKLYSWTHEASSLGTEGLPGRHAPVLLANPETNKVGLVGCRWEFEFGTGRFYNARLETALEKPMWAKSFATQRGVIPVDSFFEGNDSTEFHAADGEPMLLAAIYKFHPGRMTSVLTVPADDLVLPFHHRMPAIVPTELLDDWLDPGGDPHVLRELVTEYHTELLVAA